MTFLLISLNQTIYNRLQHTHTNLGRPCQIKRIKRNVYTLSNGGLRTYIDGKWWRIRCCIKDGSFQCSMEEFFFSYHCQLASLALKQYLSRNKRRTRNQNVNIQFCFGICESCKSIVPYIYMYMQLSQVSDFV